MENQTPPIVPPVVPIGTPKRKIWRTLGIVIIVVVVLFGLFVWWGSTLPDTSSSGAITNNINISMTENNKELAWKEFFPGISGNIADYKVSIPAEYVVYPVPQDLAAGTFLIGTPDDIKTITADPSTIAFNQAKSGVFRVRFSQNVGVDENGQITDGNAPLGEASFKAQGIENTHVVAGNFLGVAGAPIVAVSGEIKNTPVYMAYVASPADSLVVLVNLQGGSDAALNTAVWSAFVGSLNIK